jgi:hypothetical protein
MAFPLGIGNAVVTSVFRNVRVAAEELEFLPLKNFKKSLLS